MVYSLPCRNGGGKGRGLRLFAAVVAWDERPTMVTTQPAAPTAPAPLLTAAELLALPDDDYR